MEKLTNIRKFKPTETHQLQLDYARGDVTPLHGCSTQRGVASWLCNHPTKLSMLSLSEHKAVLESALVELLDVLSNFSGKSRDSKSEFFVPAHGALSAELGVRPFAIKMTANNIKAAPLKVIMSGYWLRITNCVT